MKSGKLAVVVIIATLAATILGGWALSTDVNEVTKTSYNELADITPLFNIEDAPEFVSYRSSANYTGYYVDASTKYFDGVDYNASSRANTFKLNVAPSAEVTGTETLVGGGTANMVYLFDWNSTDKLMYKINGGGKYLSLSSLVATLDPNNDYNRIVLTSNDDYDDLSMDPSSYTAIDWCIFYPTIGSNPNLPWFATDSAMANYSPNNVTLLPVAIAAVVDLDSSQVILYCDNELTKQAGIYSLSDVNIRVGGTNTATDSLQLGTDINYSCQELAPATYMDPTRGVELL